MPIATSLSEMLSLHPFLHGFTPEQIEKVASIAQIVHFEPDHLIFREGDGADFFYLIVEGWVVLEIHGPGRTYRIQTLQEGDELGWSAALPKSRKYFQARALKRVTAVALPGEALRALWDQDCKLGFLFTRGLLGTVAARLRDTQIQLLDVFGSSQPPDVD
jgi:CRP/FNR family transcriptional regulator, cyclic AMP receptor protein